MERVIVLYDSPTRYNAAHGKQGSRPSYLFLLLCEVKLCAESWKKENREMQMQKCVPEYVPLFSTTGKESNLMPSPTHIDICHFVIFQ